MATTNTLTDAKLRVLKTPGKHFDGAGLFVDVRPNGSRYWRLKYRVGGKEKLLALGVYPEVGIAAARAAAMAARQAIARGEDPSAQRRIDKARAAHDSVNTFEVVAGEWMTHQSSRWSEGTAAKIHRSMELHLFPAVGAKPLASIKPGEIMAAVKAVERHGSKDVAARLIQRVKAIYRWALNHERIDSNPMIDLVPGELLKPRTVQHRLALPEHELPAFLTRLDTYDGHPTTAMALRLLLLTATRPGEVRGARWDEFDLDSAMWVIPAERMKMKSEHRVPLSRQAVDLVRAMEPFSGDKDLLFPSPNYTSRPLSENTLNSCLARLGYKGIATAHGFRALFSTVANESGWDGDVIERQLAHIERNKVRAAYHRSTYSAERAKLLQWWADLLDEKLKNCQNGRSSPSKT